MRLFFNLVKDVHINSSTGKQYHIACAPGDLAEYLLVPGDPDRVPRIARFWDTAREVSSNREFRSFSGSYKGIPVSALSSGIGPACMSIAVNEASNVGVQTFIRVGSTGAIQRDINCGDVIISSAAVRLDYTSNCYIIPEYPAAANYEVLLALIEAAENLGISNYHVGVTATTADFYAGQNRPNLLSGASEMANLLPTLQKARVLNLEMETATLYTLASLYGLRAGAVLAVFNSQLTGEFKVGAGEKNAIKIANEATKILSEWDAEKRKSKKRHLFPSLLKSK
ncbi:MAG: nucleoside phosphorylase [Crenarchaeota archaeon]|nr:nucleoside phosphorylase [Thermoproteota archaeon]